MCGVRSVDDRGQSRASLCASMASLNVSGCILASCLEKIKAHFMDLWFVMPNMIEILSNILIIKILILPFLLIELCFTLYPSCKMLEVRILSSTSNTKVGKRVEKHTLEWIKFRTSHKFPNMHTPLSLRLLPLDFLFLCLNQTNPWKRYNSKTKNDIYHYMWCISVTTSIIGTLILVFCLEEQIFSFMFTLWPAMVTAAWAPPRSV